MKKVTDPLLTIRPYSKYTFFLNANSVISVSFFTIMSKCYSIQEYDN